MKGAFARISKDCTMCMQIALKASQRELKMLSPKLLVMWSGSKCILCLMGILMTLTKPQDDVEKKVFFYDHPNALWLNVKPGIWMMMKSGNIQINLISVL